MASDIVERQGNAVLPPTQLPSVAEAVEVAAQVGAKFVPHEASNRQEAGIESDIVERLLDFARYAPSANAPISHLMRLAALQIEKQDSEILSLRRQLDETIERERLHRADAANWFKEAEALRHQRDDAVALLERCGRVFDVLIEPDAISGSTIVSAFAQCTEMRAAIRSLQSKEGEQS